MLGHDWMTGKCEPQINITTEAQGRWKGIDFMVRTGKVSAYVSVASWLGDQPDRV